MSTRDRFEALRAAPRAQVDDLNALWADLRPTTVAELLGSWRGGDFATGHPASGLLNKIGWHGKRFDTALDGHPLICIDENGERYSNTQAAGGGHSSLWDISFRGELTATMVYDALPVFDHFKAVDDTTLMGIMNGKLGPLFGSNEAYFFWLEREA